MDDKPKQCSGCKTAFTNGQAFYTTDDGAALCEACAEARAPKCEICGKAATGEVKKIGDKLYHAECLKCTSCSGKLGSSYMSVGASMYCTDCAEDIKKLIALAAQLDEAGDRKGSAELAQQLADKGVEVPEALLNPEAPSGPACAMCDETITTQYAEIMGKSPVCVPCAQSVKTQVTRYEELVKKGESKEAVKIAQDLAAKGFNVPPELLQERPPPPHCSMCNKVITNEYAEVGEDKKKICCDCRDEYNNALQEAVKLAKASDIAGACKVAGSVKAKGMPIPKAMEEMLENFAKVPCCMVCSNRIQGKYATMGEGYICFDCGQSVNADIKSAMEHLSNEDSEGAAQIARRLKQKGVPLPDVLMEAIPKLDVPTNRPVTNRSVAEDGDSEQQKPRAVEAEASKTVGEAVAPTSDAEEAKPPAGSGASAAKALSGEKPRPQAQTATKPAAKPKAKAASSKARSPSPQPAPKASSTVSHANTTQKVSKEVISGGKSSGSLQKPDVFVRIRPLAQTGAHAEDGNKQSKVLDSWDEKSVTIGTQYMFSKGESTYAFPKEVLGPECSQQDVYEKTVPDIVAAFTQRNGFNVLFFAYGQTGTGKTHTMFGTVGSLRSQGFHEDWGIFPRVCNLAFETMRAKEGVKFVIVASAIEFHMGECSDLLGKNAPVNIDFETHEPSGNTCVELKEPGDLMPFLEQVLDNRTTRATKMNEGSSRSHAALMLDLMQLDIASNEYVRTTFTLVDLAGAERPGKADEGRMTGGMCIEFLPKLIELKATGQITEEKYKQLIPIGAQGMVINHELFNLCIEVLKATDQHKKKKKYIPPKTFATPAIKFLSAIMTGKALLRMCVCLSAASQNGWETWFSLQYGTDLSKLCVPVHAQKPEDFDKLLKKTETSAEKAKQEFDKAPMNQYWHGRKMKADGAAKYLEKLQVLKNAL